MMIGVETNSIKNIDHLNDYSKKEELVNVLTHGLATLLSIIGFILSIIKTKSSENSVHMFAVIVYNSSLICLFLCSTLYHNATSLHWRKRFKLADHCAIYLLIAGSYTPLMVVSLNTIESYSVLISIWALAIAGITFKIYFINRFKVLSVIIYLIMGWLCVAVISQLISGLSDLGFKLLFIGGFCYSIGVIFYVVKAIPYNHAIWHLFVLAGAASHWCCVYLTVI